MIDWIHNVAETRSLGIPVSPEAGVMLEEGQGGDVLTLFPLKCRDTRYGGFTRDDFIEASTDRPIYLPVIFEAMDLIDAKSGDLNPCVETSEQWHGHQWRYWPSWVGNYTEPDYDFYVGIGFHGDDIEVLRGWSGIPLDGLDPGVVTSLIQTCNSQVVNSCWPEMLLYEEMLEDGEVDPDKIFAVVERDGLDDLTSEFPDDGDYESAVSFLQLFEHLSAQHLVVDPRIVGRYTSELFAAQIHGQPLPPTPPEFDTVKDLSFVPILDMLAPGSPERALWRRLHNRARDGARLSSLLIPRSEQPNFDYREGLYDPCHYYSLPALPPGPSWR